MKPWLARPWVCVVAGLLLIATTYGLNRYWPMLEFLPALPMGIGVFLIAAGVWAWAARTPVIGSQQLVLARTNCGESDPSPALPRRIAWFAPWAWSRRTQLAMISLMLATYVLSPPVVQYVNSLTTSGRMVLTVSAGIPRVGRQPEPLLMQSYWVMVRPLSWIRARSTALRRLYDSERNVLIALFGAPATGQTRFVRFEVRRAGGVWAAGSGKDVHFKDQVAQVVIVDGQVTANGHGYGIVSNGSLVIVEEDGRVLVNGEVRQPEN
jgi:hypothetical protein